MTRIPPHQSDLKAWFAEDKSRWNALSEESKAALVKYSPYPNDAPPPSKEPLATRPNYKLGSFHFSRSRPPVAKPPKPLGRPRTWPDKHARIVSALQDGTSLSNVARDFKLPEYRIRKIAKQIGVEVPPAPRRVFHTTERNAEIVRAIKAGETASAVAKRFGITQQRVSQIEKRERNRTK